MAKSHEGGAQTQILGRFDQTRETPQVAMPRPSGSRPVNHEAVSARKKKYGGIPTASDLLDDPHYANIDRTKLLSNMPQIGKAVQELQARRANPDLQAMVMRWEGHPVKSLAEWKQKAIDYQNGGYELHPQNPAEEALSAEEIMDQHRERQAKRDAQLAREQHARNESEGHATAIRQRIGQDDHIEMPAVRGEGQDLQDLVLKLENSSAARRMPILTEKEVALLKDAYDQQKLMPGSRAHGFARFVFAQGNAAIPATREIPVMRPRLPQTREFQTPQNTPPPQPAPQKKGFFRDMMDKLRS